MREQASDGQEFVGGVTAINENAVSRDARRRASSALNLPLDQRQESSVEDERLLDLVGFLPEEENALIDELAHDQAEKFTQVQSSDHLLERLLSRFVGSFINDDIVLGARKVLVCRRVECAPVQGWSVSWPTHH